MRKPSKTVPRTLLDQARARETVLAQALQVARSVPQAREVVHVNGYTYILELYRSAGPAGGLVIQTFRCEGQRDTISAEHLDDLRHGYTTPEQSALACAVGNLRLARDRIAGCGQPPASVQP